MNFCRELSHLLWYLDTDGQPHFRDTPSRILPEYLVYAVSGYSAGPVTRDGFLATKSGKFLSKTLFTLEPYLEHHYIQISTVCINTLLI